MSLTTHLDAIAVVAPSSWPAKAGATMAKILGTIEIIAAPATIVGDS